MVVKDSVGNYHYDFLPNKDGLWTYAWEGTGIVEAASQNMLLNINPNLFG
jgi:hypothetical protein